MTAMREHTENFCRDQSKLIIGTRVDIKPGKQGDLWTNKYSADILQTWRGNCDVQYATDAYTFTHACMMYTSILYRICIVYPRILPKVRVSGDTIYGHFGGG